MYIDKSKLIIRKATKMDADEIKLFVREVVTKNYTPFLGAKNVKTFIESGMSDKEIDDNISKMIVCEYDDEVIGICIFGGDLLHLLMVKHSYQGNGIGKVIIDYVETEMFKENTTIRLETFEENLPTIAFYKKNGWKVVEKEYSENTCRYIFKFEKINTDQLIIRQEQKGDHKQIYNVVKKAFQNAEHTDGDEHNLVERLREAKEFVPELSLVAELEGKIIGHILFTEIKIGDKIALALAPVSIVPKYQSKGIGSKLIFKGHEIAKNLGYGAVVLLGHEKYYPRFGYVKASNYDIKAPFEVPDENFMVLELKGNALSETKGVVEYSPKFF